MPWFHYAAMFCETCCINNGSQAGGAFQLQFHDVFPADGCRQNHRMYLDMVCENGKVHTHIRRYGMIHAVIAAKGNTAKKLQSPHHILLSFRTQWGKFPRFLAAVPRDIPPVGWQARPIWIFRAWFDWHFMFQPGVWAQ